MLEDLLNGLEKTRLILVTDESECPGRHLLLNWIHKLGTRCDKLILACYERHPSFFKEWLPPDVQKRLYVVDGCVATPDLGRGTDLLDNAVNIVSQAGGETVGVIIDSLSLHVILKAAPVTCSVLHKLATGCNIVQVVALLHRDVHDRSTCSLVEHVASTVVELVSTERSKYTCCIRHCRSTGKVFKSKEYFITDDSFHIKGFGTASSVNNSSQNVSQGDPTAELPFNLSLTDSEKDARSRVKLPYLKDGAGDSGLPSGRIFYQPDQIDDFDEEDPDDDLNI